MVFATPTESGKTLNEVIKVLNQFPHSSTLGGMLRMVKVKQLASHVLGSGNPLVGQEVEPIFYLPCSIHV